MDIVVVSQLFYPEEFKINDLVEELVKRGHSVTVLTGKPNYPSGEYASGYGFWGVNKEVYKGAKVIRVPLLRRKDGGSLRLILNYLSFVFFASWYSLFHKLKSDAVFCFEVSPITQMIPAIFISRRNKCKSAMWVQDLWPESVSAASNLDNRLMMKALGSMVRWIYSSTDYLLVQSNGFKESILQKGDFKEKLLYAPNWAEDSYLTGSPDIHKYKYLMPEGFKVMFAGNVGAAQDFDSVIEAARLTKNDGNIKWVIVGDGRRKEAAEKKVKEYGLEGNVIFLGRFPSSEMPNLFVHADALLVSLKDEYIFSLTIPSKIQTYMAFGKPILSMLNGVANEVITDAKCGLTANASDYKTLADNVRALSKMSSEELDGMSENAKNYYLRCFDRKKVVDTIENCLIESKQ